MANLRSNSQGLIIIVERNKKKYKEVLSSTNIVLKDKVYKKYM
jgi:hypothetical protein